MDIASIWIWEVKLLSPRNNTLLALAATAALLSSCADSLNHRDTVTLGAGNAMEANAAIHTINPFPPYAENTRIQTQGTMIYRPKATVSDTAAAQ